MNLIINEAQAKILDSILLVLLEKEGSIFTDDLPLLSDAQSDKRGAKIREYEPFLNLIAEYGVANIQKLPMGGFKVSSISAITEDFYRQGGFQNKLREQQHIAKENDEDEKLRHKKLVWEYEISRFQARTKWWPLVISLLSLIISLVALLYRK